MKNIIFDISIEVFLPGQDSFSILVIFECKNYNHPVPVDDAEEFYAKIQQISGANVKGIIASTHSFQEGTVNFSKSKGIGLLRYYENADFKWILPRSPSSLLSKNDSLNKWISVYRGITDEAFRSKYFDCYCYIDGNYTNSLNLFLFKIFRTNSEEEFNHLLAEIENLTEEHNHFVSFRKESEIEDLCESVLTAISYSSGSVLVEDVCKWQSAKGGLRVTLENPPEDGHVCNGVLGTITFEPNEIKIFPNAHSSFSQQKFTLAHELGHLLLDHGKYLVSEYCLDSDFDFENPVELGIKDIIRMEWQANYFASCLLLPKGQFVEDFMRLRNKYDIIDRGFGLLYLDEQKSNINNYYRISDELLRKYEVSRRVIKISLKRLGLLKEPEILHTTPSFKN